MMRVVDGPATSGGAGPVAARSPGFTHLRGIHHPPAAPRTGGQEPVIDPDLEKNRVKPEEAKPPNSFVRIYSDFLLFWVILGLTVSYSIVLGIGWGALFLKIVGLMVDSDRIPAESNPFSLLLAHKRKVIWLFVAGLITYAFCNIGYDCFAGYRLKQGVRRFLAGSLLLLMALSAAAVLLFWAARASL